MKERRSARRSSQRSGRARSSSPRSRRPIGPRLIFATRNPGKVDELRALVEAGDLAVRVAPATALQKFSAPHEDGRTFAANARKKALHYSRLVRNDLVVADDSGLEIDALDGQPGVRSARLGGPAATDLDRVRLILVKLAKVPLEQRTARFKCVIAIAKNDEVLRTFSGEVEGLIAFEPSGSSGFGYDPIFYFPPMNRTFADLTPAEKNSVSHRGAAMTQAIAWLAEQFPRSAGDGPRRPRKNWPSS